MTDTAKSNLRGAALALMAFALYASHDVVVKLLGANYSPVQILFFSTLLSFPLVMLMLMRDQTRATLIPTHPWWTALRTASTTVTGVCVFYAFSNLPLAQTYSIIFAMPLLITVLSIPVLRERVGPHRWAAVVVGLIGVLVVLRPGSEPMSLGHIAALTAAFSSSLAAIIVRKIGRDERTAVMLLYPMMSNFLVMAAALPFVYQPMPIEHLGLVGLMSALGFVGGLLSISAYKLGDAAVVAPMQYSQILWAALFGTLLFAETPSGATWAGAAIVIASGVYIVVRESLSGLSVRRPVTQTRLRAEAGNTPRASTMQGLAGRTSVRAH